MKKVMVFMVVSMVALFLVAPVFAQDDLAKRLNDVLNKGPEDGHWWVSAQELSMWIKTGKTDFIVVDVRPGETSFKLGHVPGAIHIPYSKILVPENLAKLPKDKKIVLVCNTGQLQNLPVVPLRVLGYDAATLTLGYASWIKDSQGAQQMKSVMDKAATRNYPVKSETVTPAEE
jgi:rhodanese-related sulfurtransferase